MKIAPTPLHECAKGGFRFGIQKVINLPPPIVRIKFGKPAKSTKKLLDHLTARGLIIADRALASSQIERIGYYRLLIYMRPLQDASKLFLPGKTFSDVVALYEFDRELRLLCLDAVERIEIALRAALINKVAVVKTSHFYTKAENFDTPEGYQEFLKAVIKEKDGVVKHYYAKYSDPPFPPIWAILELVTLGTLSRFYSNLNTKNRKLVAKSFGFDEAVLVSWFRATAALRNRCAHHNRVWNFEADKPKVATRLSTLFLVGKQEMFYARAIVLNALMKQIVPATDWNLRLRNLFVRFPTVNSIDLGFPINWEADPFWN